MTPAPWERQPDESDEGYQAFTVYLVLGPSRSVRKAWEAVRGRQRDGKHAPKSFEQRATDFNWVDRASAFDDWQRNCSIRYDVEQSRKIVNSAREAAQVCIEEMKALIQPERGAEKPTLRELTSALTALTNAISKMLPSTEENRITPETLASLVVKALQEQDPTVIEAMVKGMQWMEQNAGTPERASV